MGSSNGDQTTKVLSVHECWKHLRTASVGRLAVVVNGAPEIFPVNYLPEDGTVIFRTGPGTKADALAAGGTVALEADGLNTYGTIAWSVVVKGEAEVVELGVNEPLPGEDPAPWEEGVKDRLVRITPGEITGRQFVVTSSPTHWWRPRDIASPDATTIQ